MMRLSPGSRDALRQKPQMPIWITSQGMDTLFQGKHGRAMGSKVSYMRGRRRDSSEIRLETGRSGARHRQMRESEPRKLGPDDVAENPSRWNSGGNVCSNDNTRLQEP